MPKQSTHIPVVREWCQSLGVLTAVSISRQEAEIKLAAYVPMLMQEFNDAAFTTASLNYVARQCTKGFPTYPELANALSAWWRDQHPVRALPAPPPEPERQPPTDEEIAYVRERVKEIMSLLRSPEQPAEDRRRPDAKHLTPAQLDIVNPLPNGLKRVPVREREPAVDG